MMKKKGKNNSILRFLNSLYIKLFQINDTPQKISLGLGLGVSLGIVPGTGPIAALFLATIFRANRASALLGSLLTNTWLSFLTFFIAIKIGSTILGTKWEEVYNNWIYFLKGFRWLGLFKLSALKVILPIVVGYFVIAFFFGALAYLLSLITIKTKRHYS